MKTAIMPNGKYWECRCKGKRVIAKTRKRAIQMMRALLYV